MSENQLPPPDRSVKVPHLVFGLLFLGLAAVWALVAGQAVDADNLPLIAPGVLVAAGVIGLVASIATGRNRQRAPHQGPDQWNDWSDEPEDQSSEDQSSEDQPDTTTQERQS